MVLGTLRFVHPLLEEANIPLYVPPQRTEHSWQIQLRRSSRYLAFIYCFGCCLAFILGIRDNLNALPLHAPRHDLYHNWDLAMSQTLLTQYTLRSATTPMYALDPFVLLGGDTTSDITICAWIYDADVRNIETWLHAWTGPASILVVTYSKPETKDYHDLLTYIHHMQFKPLARHLSIHILQIKEGEPSPNTWLNLAKLFVRTDYTLMWPGDVSPALPTHITANMVSKSLIPGRSVYILGSRIATYPFVSLVPVVIPSRKAFWCTERLFIGRNRENDWDECLWQISLEFGPAVRLWQGLDLHNHAVLPRIAASDMLLRHRLRNRFRAESCDAAYRRLIATEILPKAGVGQVEWMRKFCARTIDKKLNN